MAEMKISNTLVNDTSTGVIAFAKLIKDELINWAEYYNVTKDWTDADKQDNLMQGKLNALFLSIGDRFLAFLQDEDIADSTINTWKEIENFLSGYTDDTTLASIVTLLNTNIESRLTVPIAQETGNNEDKVMSQKAVSDRLKLLSGADVTIAKSVIYDREIILLDEMLLTATIQLQSINKTPGDEGTKLVYILDNKKIVLAYTDLLTTSTVYYVHWKNNRDYVCDPDNSPLAGRVYLCGGISYYWDGSDLVEIGREVAQSGGDSDAKLMSQAAITSLITSSVGGVVERTDELSEEISQLSQHSQASDEVIATHVKYDRDTIVIDEQVATATIIQGRPPKNPGEDGAKLVYVAGQKKIVSAYTESGTTTYYNTWKNGKFVCNGANTPLEGKIYVLATNNVSYRWDGTNLVEVGRALVQSAGTSETSVMSQKAATEQFTAKTYTTGTTYVQGQLVSHNGVLYQVKVASTSTEPSSDNADYSVLSASIVQATGSSQSSVMSQKATTDALAECAKLDAYNKFAAFNEFNAGGSFSQDGNLLLTINSGGTLITSKTYLKDVGGIVDNPTQGIDLASYINSLEDRIAALEALHAGEGSEYYPEYDYIEPKAKKLYRPYLPIAVTTNDNFEYGIVFKVPIIELNNNACFNLNNGNIFTFVGGSPYVGLECQEGLLTNISNGVIGLKQHAPYNSFYIAMIFVNDYKFGLSFLSSESTESRIKNVEETYIDSEVIQRYLLYGLRPELTKIGSASNDACWISGVITKENGYYIFEDLKDNNLLTVGNSDEFFANELVFRYEDGSTGRGLYNAYGILYFKYMQTGSYPSIPIGTEIGSYLGYNSCLINESSVISFMRTDASVTTNSSGKMVYDIKNNDIHIIDTSDNDYRFNLSDFVRPLTVSEASSLVTYTPSKLPNYISGTDIIICSDGYIDSDGTVKDYGTTTVIGKAYYAIDLCKE